MRKWTFLFLSRSLSCFSNKTDNEIGTYRENRNDQNDEAQNDEDQTDEDGLKSAAS